MTTVQGMHFYTSCLLISLQLRLSTVFVVLMPFAEFSCNCQTNNMPVVNFTPTIEDSREGETPVFFFLLRWSCCGPPLSVQEMQSKNTKQICADTVSLSELLRHWFLLNKLVIIALWKQLINYTFHTCWFCLSCLHTFYVSVPVQNVLVQLFKQCFVYFIFACTIDLHSIATSIHTWHSHIPLFVDLHILNFIICHWEI